MPGQGYWQSKPPAGVPINYGHPLAQAMIGCWLFDSGPGGCADRVGTSNLTDSGKSTRPPGLFGGPCGAFASASSQYLQVPDNQALSITGTLTIAGWFRLASANLAGASLAMKYRLSGNARSYGLALESSRFEMVASSNGTTFTIAVANTFGAPAIGPWYFVVGQHRNGVDIRVSVNGGAWDVSSFTGGVYDGTANFEIAHFDSQAGYYFDGSVDNVMLWNRWLSDKEIAELYAEPYQMFAAPVWRRYFVTASAPPPPPPVTVTDTGDIWRRCYGYF